MDLREDYFGRYQTLVSAVRGKRPNDFVIPLSEEQPGLLCPFCPGNEQETPLEIGRVGDNKKWDIRWVYNKYSAFDENFGKNIIIIESREHKKQLGDFSKEEFLKLIDVYRKIYADFFSQGYEYPFIFKNFGLQAGASRVHSHSQGAIYKKTPFYIKRLSRLTSQNSCRYCDIIKTELSSSRVVLKNNNAVAFCPRAPLFNNEIWVMPLSHINHWNEFNEAIFADFSLILLKILKIVHKQRWHYNFYFEFGTDKDPLHFNCKILPRLNTWAAIEIGVQNYIISISPEDSAQFYRENLKEMI